MGDKCSYDVIVVGGGSAGLTSAAYLCRKGYDVLLCEKEEKAGGLVGTFKHKGFEFDSGIRAFENSGIIFPMLDQLGIDIDFIKSEVSIGIEDSFIKVKSEKSLLDYEKFLASLFPGDTSEIHQIIGEIRKVMDYMDVIYGIDNPLFVEYMDDPGYIFKTLLPWFLKYQVNIRKAMKLDKGVNDYLLEFTKNQALIDMITQHFFQDTPTFFALSYFGLYLDYSYPKGGTGVLVSKLNNYINSNGGSIARNTEVTGIDLEGKKVKTSKNETFSYEKIIWAGDSKSLYRMVEGSQSNLGKDFKEQKKLVEENSGGDSIFTIYLGTDLARDYFRDISGPHTFYTPKKQGLSSREFDSWGSSKEEIKESVSDYLELTTFEISIPSLRDRSLAPEGKTGLIISTLMDYDLVKKVKEQGWYDEFKEFCVRETIGVLNGSIFKGLEGNIIFSFASTPLTIERVTGNFEGAITGWAFKKEGMPSVANFRRIADSVLTPIEGIYQAGQWTFSPSGLPISILTGKLAADQLHKDLKKPTKKEKV